MGRQNRKRSKNDGLFWDSLVLNKRTYEQYLARLTELATCMFEYENLPSTIDARFMEMTLFSNGMCVAFKDEELGMLALPVAVGGRLNVYNIPTNRRAFASNGYNNNLTENNSVIIYNNYLHTNSTLDVQMFARRLAEIDRIIDVNIKAQKTPTLLTCTEQERLSMMNLYEKYDGNQPFIFGSSDLNPKSVSVLKTDAPFNADKLYQLKTQYWNEALTYLGISNVNVVKKERLISDEVMRNQGGTVASRFSRLESRRQGWDMVNRMFGLNVKVSYREDFQYLDEEFLDEDVTPNGEMGGVDDE